MSDQTSSGDRIAAGLVSPDAFAEDGLAAGLPGGLFELAAVCDEGMPESALSDGPLPCCSDFHVLLQDERIELVLVEGPVEKRRDFAVRALNAGRHVVVAHPFAETSVDATRVMKTALTAGLAATMDMPWRDSPDLASLRTALAAENVAVVQGALAFRFVPPPEDGAAEQPGLLAEVGLELLDQIHLLLRDDVKAVSAHLQQAVSGAGAEGLLIYLPLRGGGWAVAHAGRRPNPNLPAWVVETPVLTLTAADGRTVARGSDGKERIYEAPPNGVGFWENLHGVIRRGEELKCHPADIVKAMKLHEAALEAARTGQPVSV